MDSKIKNIKFLQLNCDKSLASHLQILQLACEERIQIICLQEPYVYVSHLNGTVKYTAPDNPNYNCYYATSGSRPYTMIYVQKNITSHKLINSSNEHCTIIKMDNHDDITNRDSFFVASIYSNPTDQSAASRFHIMTKNLSSIQKKNLLLCADANAKSGLWSSPITDKKGQEIENLLLGNNLSVQ